MNAPVRPHLSLDGTALRHGLPAPASTTSFRCFPAPFSAGGPNCPRIAGMAFDWVYVNPFHETGGSRSLYAVKNPEVLDERFRDGHESVDDAQIAAFIEDASAHGLKVMTDLVVNHTARDATSRIERPDLFRRDENGEIESPYAVDPVDPTDPHGLGRSGGARLRPRRGARIPDRLLGPLYRPSAGARREGLPLRRRLQGAGAGVDGS